MRVFTVDDRRSVREWVLERAAADDRVIAAAVIGSLANGGGDRWSDLDLTFGVEDGVALADVLDDWTHALTAELGGVHLFDLPSHATIYRVFMLPGCLQCDLSFTPASVFGARGPKFELHFGNVVEHLFAPPPDAGELFGYAVHHALRARVCIERGRVWQAEYWISSARDYALNLACRRRDIVAWQGRGFDDLPAGAREPFVKALVGSLEPDELLRALGCVIEALQHEAEGVAGQAAELEPHLRLLTQAWEV